MDLPFEDYFNGQTAPFNYPMLSYNLNKMGCERAEPLLPDPLPEVVQDRGREGLGGLLPLRLTPRSPRGPRCPPSPPGWPAENADALAKVNAFLQDKQGTDPAGTRQGEETVHDRLRVAPGRRPNRSRLAGPGRSPASAGQAVINDRKDQMAAMRKLALRITCDGADEAGQVWCPLGDFFGTAPGDEPLQVAAHRHDRGRGCYASGTCRLPRGP